MNITNDIETASTIATNAGRYALVFTDWRQLQAATHGGPWPGCYRVPVKPAEKRHMTGKPVELMRELVRAAVPPGGHVLDLFQGSASTGVAALQERRHYTGIEVTRHYHEVSVQRLQELPPLV